MSFVHEARLQRTVAGLVGLATVLLSIGCTEEGKPGGTPMGSIRTPILSPTPIAQATEPPEAGSWDLPRHQPIPRSIPSLVAGPDDQVVMLGGYDGQGLVPEIESYDPRARRTSVIGALLFPRQSQGAVRLQDGRILVAGGVGDASTGPILQIELFDPKTGSSQQAGELPGPRILAAVLFLKDGSVVITGGGSSSIIPDDIELYDPGSRRVRVAGELPTNVRGEGSAVELDDGRVLIVAGGHAVLFDPKRRMAA